MKKRAGEKMQTTNYYCDYCKKKITSEGVWTARLNGFCITLGYSDDGWGSRQDMIMPQSVDLCDDCFSKVKEKAQELVDTIKLLRGW